MFWFKVVMLFKSQSPVGQLDNATKEKTREGPEDYIRQRRLKIIKKGHFTSKKEVQIL